MHGIVCRLQPGWFPAGINQRRPPNQCDLGTSCSFFAIVCLSCVFAYDAIGDDAELQTLVCGNLAALQALWRAAAFGYDPNRTERAVWIVRRGNHGYGIWRWKHSAERNHETWRGPVPLNVLAQFHTHPANAAPRPSRNDARVAAKIGVPVFVISREGIWSVDPYGRFLQHARWDWSRKLSLECHQ
jgi:Prokaryotic homologs of the JAB domain